MTYPGDQYTQKEKESNTGIKPGFSILLIDGSGPGEAAHSKNGGPRRPPLILRSHLDVDGIWIVTVRTDTPVLVEAE